MKTDAVQYKLDKNKQIINIIQSIENNQFSKNNYQTPISLEHNKFYIQPSKQKNDQTKQNKQKMTITRRKGRSGFIVNMKHVENQNKINLNDDLNRNMINNLSYLGINPMDMIMQKYRQKAQYEKKQIQQNNFGINYDRIFRQLVLKRNQQNIRIASLNKFINVNDQKDQGYKNNKKPDEQIQRRKIQKNNINNDRKKTFSYIQIVNKREDSQRTNQMNATNNNEFTSFSQRPLNINLKDIDISDKFWKQSKYKIQQQHKMQNGQILHIQIFLQCYYALKSILENLRAGKLLKSIKNYIQILMKKQIWQLDNIIIPLHKKKIIKHCLLYERVSIVALACNYATDNLLQNFNYLSNIIKYCLCNNLIILKLLNDNNPQIQQILHQINKTWKMTENMFTYQKLKIHNQIIIQTITKIIKYNTQFQQNIKNIIKNYSKFTLHQSFTLLLQAFAIFLNQNNLQHKIYFLAVSPNPYLPPLHLNHYTLVIDIIQIMCHSKKNQNFRPFSQFFLNQISKKFQIVSFSMGNVKPIDKVLNILDKNNKIAYRLYKHHSIKSKTLFCKDLRRLGRDLNKTINLDVASQNGNMSMNNITLQIPRWNGYKNDRTLLQVCTFLMQELNKSNISSYQLIQKYKQFSASRNKLIKNKKQSIFSRLHDI